MTQDNGLNVTLLNSQLNKSKSAIKNETEVVCNSYDETNFPNKSLLTNRQLTNSYSKHFCKSFIN